MAFARAGLSRIGGSGNGGCMWMYTSTDNKAAVGQVDYFLPAIVEFTIGDVMFCKDTTIAGSPVVHSTYVKALASGSVQTAAGIVITA